MFIRALIDGWWNRVGKGAQFGPVFLRTSFYFNGRKDIFQLM